MCIKIIWLIKNKIKKHKINEFNNISQKIGKKFHLESILGRNR